MKKILFFIFLVIGTQAGAETQTGDHDFLLYHPVTTRLGLGAGFGPGTFNIAGNVEYNLDRFLSFGPKLQAGFRDSFTTVIPTLNARLTFPIYPSKRLEGSLIGGMGWMYRNISGTMFNNFNYLLGANIDAYIIKNLTVGLGFNWNVTSSSVQRTYGNLIAQASYRF